MDGQRWHFTPHAIASKAHVFSARINNVLFSLIWSMAPILVSVTAFFVYVMRGNPLTVGTAFTVGNTRRHLYFAAQQLIFRLLHCLA